MTFAPDLNERLARARADLRMGLPVVFSEGLIVLAVETLTQERFDLLGTFGVPTLTITKWRAATLDTVAQDGCIARIPLPPYATHSWVRSIADPTGDVAPTISGTLASPPDGPADPHRAAITLLKAAQLLPTAISVEVLDPEGFAKTHNLTLLSEADAMPTQATPMESVSHAGLPMAASDAGRVHIFRSDDGSQEHYAIEIGTPDRATPVLARLHSACFTGDVIGSLKCDCGPQLRGALAQMGSEGAGVLLYLNQEGRGIGLANKMRAYSLQNQGLDTVQANHRLGFNDDERDFRIGADILRKMGFEQVRLLTNNPAKVAKLESSGLIVTDRIPLKVGKNPLNAKYLATKAAKSGHLL